MSKLLISISRKQAFIFAAFLVFYEFSVYVANDMILPAMVYVIDTFHANVSAIPMSLYAYVLGGATLQIFLGPISDRVGRRPVMLSGVLLFLVATIFIIESRSIEHFLTARLFQGMGLCFVGTVGYASIQEMFTEMDAVRVTSCMTNISILAPLLGPLLGAVFVYFYNWRFIFVMIAICSVIALWGLWRFMPETVRQKKTDESQEAASSVRESLSRYRDLFLNPAFVLGAIALGLLWVPCLTWIALAPIILVKQAHLTIIEYSLWQLPVFGAAILGNVVLRYLTYRLELKPLVVRGSYFVAGGLGVLALLPLLFGSHYIWLMPGVILFFFGMGIANGPLTRFILFCTPVSKGTASALMSVISMLIPAFAIRVMTKLYTSYHHVYAGGCFIAGILFIVALMVSFCTSEGLLPSSRRGEGEPS